MKEMYQKRRLGGSASRHFQTIAEPRCRVAAEWLFNF
jgi:hypothetical protein